MYRLTYVLQLSQGCSNSQRIFRDALPVPNVLLNCFVDDKMALGVEGDPVRGFHLPSTSPPAEDGLRVGDGAAEDVDSSTDDEVLYGRRGRDLWLL